MIDCHCRRGARALLLLVAVAWTPLAGADRLSLQVEDVGLRNHASIDGNFPVFLRLANSSTEAFTGSVEFEQRQSWDRFDQTVTIRTSSVRVQVPPLTEAEVCLQVKLQAWQEPLVFRALDSERREQAVARVDRKKQPLELGSARSRSLVGLIAQDSTVIQDIQHAIVLATGTGEQALFKQAPVKLLFLAADRNWCPGSFAAFNSLIVAMPVGRLSDQQRDSLLTALLEGAQVVVIDSFVGNSEFLQQYTGDGAGPVAAGRGLVLRAETPDDYQVLSQLTSPETEKPAPPALHRWPPSELISIDFWQQGRHTTINLPGPLLFALALLYLALVGPVNYLFLRQRNRREHGWVTTTLIAVLSGAVLAPVVMAYRLPGTGLDTTTFVFSRSDSGDVEFKTAVRLTSRDQAERQLLIRGPWRILHPGEVYQEGDHTEFAWQHQQLSIKRLHTPRWSSFDLDLEGWLATQLPAPVAWNEQGIVNQAGAAIREALLITADGYHELDRIEAGATRPLEILPQSLVRFSRWRRSRQSGPITLADVIGFDRPEHQEQLLGAVRGIFVGLVETVQTPLLDISLDKQPAHRRNNAVLVHCFMPTPAQPADHQPAANPNGRGEPDE